MSDGPEDPLVALLLDSYAMHPDELVPRVQELAQKAGGRELEVWIADIAQDRLHLLGRGETAREAPVDDSLPGAAFRDVAVHRVDRPDGEVRLWLPVLDSAERVGVIGVTLDRVDDQQARWWMALASLLGELVMAKSPYGDSLIVARRSAQPTLAAEMRMHWHPPTELVSPRVTVAGLFEPAYEIAGDTFDYAVNGPAVHVALFDAMGHGLEASRMANLAVAAYRHSRRQGLDLADTVVATDQVLQEQFGDVRFVTGQLGQLDTDTGELRMVNMGHPAPLVFRSGRFAGPLRCEPCLPLGLGGRPSEEGRAELRPGDVVLFHTDGVSEARDPSGAPFGTDRVAALVEELLVDGARASEVLRRVVDAALAHQGDRPGDDATLLLLGYRLPVVDPLEAGGITFPAVTSP